MSTLTKQERDGLEEIFMSINTNNKKCSKLRHFSPLFISKHISLNASKFLKMAKQGLNESKISKFTAVLYKKKKNLSK